MKPIWAAVIATGMLATQEAGASSMIVLAPIEPADAGSFVYFGAPPVVTSLPDSSIVTAALGEGESAPVARRAGVARRAAKAIAPAWPPAPSRSLIARGTPLPPALDNAADGPAEGRPSLRAAAPVMPIVIRGGLVGDAFPVLSDPRPAEAFAPPAPPAARPVPAIEEGEGERNLSRRQQRREERLEERSRAEPAPTVELPPPAAPTGLPM